MDNKKLLLFTLLANHNGHSLEDINNFIQSQMKGNQGLSLYDSPAMGYGKSFNFNGVPITQAYGVQSPYDVFSHGINTGVDFGVGVNTPITLPQGKWKVLEAAKGIRGGYIGDSANRGYGNSVLVQNMDTGEKIRTSHLSDTKVNPGDILDGGSLLGLSGATGNVTGPHLDVEYQNPQGQYGDILKTAYAMQLLGHHG